MNESPHTTSNARNTRPSSQWLILLPCLLAAAAFAACSGDGSQEIDRNVPGEDTGGGGGSDTGGGGGSDTGGGGSDTGGGGSDAGGEDTEPSDATTDDTGDGGPTFVESEIFWECEEHGSTSECEAIGSQAQMCVSNVCVIPPTEPAVLAEELDSIAEERPEVPVELDCWTDPDDPRNPFRLVDPPEGVETVTIEGEIERFGSGSPTRGLCLSVYNEEAVLPFLTFSECHDLREDDEDAFIACMQLDPCRCEAMDEDFTGPAAEAWATPIEDETDCFTFIGYCDGIADADARTACEARVQERSLLDDVSTLIYNHTVSIPDPDNPDRENGIFAVDEIPVNTRVAFKISGRESRWRDTWEYGLFTRADRIRSDGTIGIGGNAVADGAWRTIPSSVGLSRGIPNTNGALAGVIRDCGSVTEDGEPDRDPWAITHATVGISFDAEKLAYFNGNPDDTLPLPGRSDTNVLAVYAAINLPPGPNRVSPIICTGEPCDGDNLVNVGSRNVFQTPKSVIIATFEGFLPPASDD